MLTIDDLAMLRLWMTCGSMLRVPMILLLWMMMMLRWMRRMMPTPTLIMVWVHHRLRTLTTTSSPFPSSGIMVIATFVFMMVVHSTMLDCCSSFVEGNPLIKPKMKTRFNKKINLSKNQNALNSCLINRFIKSYLSQKNTMHLV